MFGISFSLLLVSGLFLVVQANGPPTVKIGKTTIIGTQIPVYNQEFFGGIPYAEPPINSLRLRPPVLKSRLNATQFKAIGYGKSCLQLGVNVSTLSEDCLTVNVVRPSGTKPGARLPVMFWTYGGGFYLGSSSFSQYNSSTLVAHSVSRGTPIIYVSFNYRLGPLGFPQGQEADNRGALNLGLKDQLAALQWVQDNIQFFGGDKTKVTLFGESAGAIMTAILYLNSHIEKLARAAILESGSASSPVEYHASRREIDWQNFVVGVSSCASLQRSPNTFDCLRKANASEIFQGVASSFMKQPEMFGFDPTLDGVNGILPDITSRLFARGQFARIPFIAGTNLDEGTVFVAQTLSSEEQIRQSLIANYSPPIVNPALFNSTMETILKLYPDDPSLGSPFNTGNETFGLSSSYKRGVAIQGDIGFEAPRRTWSRVASNAGVKHFAYLFTQPQSNGLPPSFGVNHGSEIAFVYGQPVDRSAPAIKLSTMMMDYWISFATSLDPNDGHGSTRPQWKQYTPNNQMVIQLNGDNTTMIPDSYRQEQLDFIMSRAPVFHQ